MGQFPDEGVDLAQREGRRGPAVEVAADEAIGGEPAFEGGGGGLLDDGGTVLPGEGEDAEDAADAAGAVVAVDVVADGGDGGAGALGGGEQGEGLARGAGGSVGVGDAMPAPWRAEVLAEELAGARVEQSDLGTVPLHVDAAADPAGRRAVVGGCDLDAAVEMHGAAAVFVVAERLERQRAEGRTLLGEHGGDLALGRAVDAGVGPALLPAVQVGLGGVELLEAEAAQGRLLGVADGGLDLALPIGVSDAARQGDDAVVGEHVAVERIELGVVDVGGEDALLQVIEVVCPVVICGPGPDGPGSRGADLECATT